MLFVGRFLLEVDLAVFVADVGRWLLRQLNFLLEGLLCLHGHWHCNKTSSGLA